MYKIPENFDFSTLNGQTINQISFGQNVVTIFFSPEIYIQWSGRFKISKENGATDYEEVFPVKNDFGLLEFLEKKVETVGTDKNRNNLLLVFEDKTAIEIISDIAFEAFSLYINGSRILV